MLFYEQVGSATAQGDESGVSGIALNCSDGDAVVDETDGDPDAEESGGAALPTGSSPAADAEAVEREQEKQDDEGEEGASPEGQGEEEGEREGEGVASGAMEAQEEKSESATAAEEGVVEGQPNEEIWI